MILLDTNVVLDVVQKRNPYYRASALVLDRVLRKEVMGALPAHVVTTIHFLVSRHQSADTASRVVEWLLGRFSIATVGKPELRRAQALRWTDFEDAVVAAAAETSDCDTIITRKVQDFRASPVTALTPEEYLLGLDNVPPS